jgi:hypothetical protein
MLKIYDKRIIFEKYKSFKMSKSSLINWNKKYVLIKIKKKIIFYNKNLKKKKI